MKTRRSCPCEFGSPCVSQCSCARPYMSGGCRRCCRYGSAEQQQVAADYIIANEAPTVEVRCLADSTWRIFINGYGIADWPCGRSAQEDPKAYAEEVARCIRVALNRGSDR